MPKIFIISETIFVLQRIYVCLYISQVWIRATLLYSPLVNDVAEPQTNQFRKTRAFMDIYAPFSLSRLIIPRHVDALGQ
jgi:hypothetical protein